MHVLVASDFELGSHRAHAINVVKTAGGMRRRGHEVTVLCREPADVAAHEALVQPYDEPGLTWQTVPVDAADGDQGPRRERAFAQALVDRLDGVDLVYARHFRAGLAAAQRGVPTALETHAYVGDANPALQAAIEATRGPLRCLVTISDVLAQHYVSRGADAARVAVVPDGVDVARFRAPDDGAIGACPFPRTLRQHVLYAGHLYDYKGIPTVLAAARRMPDVGFELLGGAPEDIARQRAASQDLPNVRVHGLVPHRDVPRWLWHADALLLPPSAREPSAGWTSPVKLGEYLASARPIVASAIPGLQAWVDERCVTWFAPDDALDLTIALREALGEQRERRATRVAAATSLAGEFDYRNRAARILAGVDASTPTASPLY